MASVAGVKAMRLGYFRSAENYAKHMCATEPVLTLAWALGAAGLALPLLLRNPEKKAAAQSQALARITPALNPGGIAP